MKNAYKVFLIIIFSILFSGLAFAEGGSASFNLISSNYAIIALLVFVVAYALVPLENVIHLKKSKPVLVASGLIWVLASLAFSANGLDQQIIRHQLEHSFFEYSELFLFLLTAMTYINTMEERNVFEVIRGALVSQGLSLKKVFWTTGLLSFFLSPIADNLTTALIMAAVVIAVSGKNKKFVSLACINVVVAANAGGAFSPFGDITTLMVWQKGKLEFFEFFSLFLPSLVNWVVPAFIMSMFIGNDDPKETKVNIKLKYGAIVVVFLFVLTVATAIIFHSILHLSPAMGMMFGLGYLGIFSYVVSLNEGRNPKKTGILGNLTIDYNPRIERIHNQKAAITQLVNENEYPAFAIDKNRVVTNWNSHLEELTGVKSEDIIGTSEVWKVFYNYKRSVLADLVLDRVSADEAAYLYEGNMQANDSFERGLDGVGFFPELGENGKWLAFSALPIYNESNEISGAVEILSEIDDNAQERIRFDIMRQVAGAEWDTLLFFYGIILCVSGLSLFGYLDSVSKFMYGEFSTTMANSMVGVLSALLDNIPVMLAVLTMNPEMGDSQWLLVTLTAGVGGSLLAIGSAAGVALLGVARGKYTFMSHLKWFPVILLGYIASIFTHLLLNGV